MITDDKWGPTITCSDKELLKPIFFYYGDYWLNVTPDDYLVDLGTG